MRVCDICKNEGVRYSTIAVVNEKGNAKSLELCGKCYTELECRGKQHRYLAYTETVEAMTGKRPPKTHWWDMISFDL